MQVEIFRYLGSIAPHQLRDKLNTIAADPFERRPFRYLDIPSWLDSKIENLPVQAVWKEEVVFYWLRCRQRVNYL